MSRTQPSRNRWPIFFSFIAIAAAFVTATIASAQTPAQASPYIEHRWKEFQADPVKAMNTLPTKTVNGKAIALPSFQLTPAQTKAFILKKSDARLMCDANGVCLKDVLEGRAAATTKAEDFFDLKEFKGKKPVLNLEEMENQNLKESKLAETPWSDTYWPIYQGILGARYANQKFSGATNWKGFYDFISKGRQTLKAISDKATPLNLETLSPSEKYDLLIGDLSGGTYDNGYLTPHMWQEGKEYWDDKGEVEPWMGICHGWAPAAYMLPRPKKAIDVSSADGKNSIRLYPSDIKGLTSYLWAKANTPSRFIGGRCNTKDPKTDPATGRVLDAGCFDTNPGNWHQIVVNQIGVAKKSFVMDATYDYEVWNQPVYSYSYKYFNPQTGKSVSSLAKATVDVAKFTKDKFAKFRSKNAAKVVGIEMEVTYVVETQPSHDTDDAPEKDATNSATYMYDLELDANGDIIGGEWYQNAHPDFMWSPTADARAESFGDGQVGAGKWDASQPLPQFWKDIAVATAVHGGMPLAAIVEGLIEASNK